MDVARGDVRNCTRKGFIFVKGYHHSQTFSCEFKKKWTTRESFFRILFPLYGTVCTVTVKVL